ncbi:zona pellucida sperm-binding protein 3-like [Sardina pilchardus]|uniref:zona pellucida sperm-binding protein 3-like n=1 Tax=Sardina pilchardus TaxID=27697 RepID=UPI002E135F5A
MRKLVSLLCGALTIACLLPVFVSALPRSVRPMLGWQQPSSLPQKGVASSPWNPAPAPSRPQVAKGESERRPDITSIKVICHPDYMEIQMDADLLGIGVPADVEDIRLGKSDQEACRAIPSESGKFVIAAALTDCGTEHVITAEQLLYKNTLDYSPPLLLGGVIRTQPASFPIECYYKRKFNLSSIPVMPTWVPFLSTRADEGQLAFSLHLMTDDWAFRRASATYYLSDVINIEASVEQFNHNPMRVFVDHCVATVTPAADSVPRYDFVEQGCMMDSFLTGSSSQFLPRLQNDKLRFQLDAFRFHQEERSELYISCLLRAETGAEMDGVCRACSFVDNRWQSADSEDWLCDGCVAMPGSASNQKTSAPAPQSSAGSRGSSSSSSAMVHLRPRSASNQDSTRGWEKEERVGPISVMKKTKRPLAQPEAPEAMQGLPQPMPEMKMAASAKPGPRGYSPSSDGLPRELDKPVTQSPDDGNVNQFFDLWKKHASSKDWAELMGILQKASSPAVTTAEPSTAAPVTGEEPVALEEEPSAAPTPLPLSRGFKMADLKLDEAPLKEDVATSGNKDKDSVRR